MRKRFLWIGIVACAIVGVGVAVWISTREMRALQVIKVSDDLSLEVIKVLKHGEKFEAKPAQYRDIVLKYTPRKLMKYLITNGYVSAGFLAPSSRMFYDSWSNDLSNQLIYVARIRPSDGLVKDIETSGESALEKHLKRNYGSSKTGTRLILKSPDNRIMQRCDWNWNGVSRRTFSTAHGSVTKVDFSTYMTFSARPVPDRYPEMDLVLLSKSDDDAYSTRTLKITNPYYKPLIPKTDFREAPFEMTTAGITLKVKHVYADAAWTSEWVNRGEPGYRANTESGEQSCTILLAEVLENGKVTDLWDVSSVRYFDDKGKEYGGSSSSGKSKGGHVYLNDINILALAEAVDTKIRVKRAGDFPADEFTTVSLPLPAKGTSAPLTETISFWNGNSELKAISNQAEDPQWDFRKKSLKLVLTSPQMDPAVRVTEAYLEGTTATQKLSTDMYGGSLDRYSFQFRLEKPWDMVNHRDGGPIDVSEFTTLTVGLASPRYVDFECVIKPEKATEPYKGEEYRNVFAWRE